MVTIATYNVKGVNADFRDSWNGCRIGVPA